MERKLTDYLPVTRHGNKRNGLTRGKQEERDRVESTGSSNRKRQPASRRAGATEQETDVAFLPELSPLDKLIRFDLDWQFGPCTGITRLERWQRAEELGLTPPRNIRDILMAHHADDHYQSNLWISYAI
ncbi:DNA polymerase delta subunit 4 [Rhinoderma darwinii]|uniref:DNA polymerase delta subunit 4 n=1 Tax=Rhinoderma darwinii TaxID=43563 RepID=UPI003F67CA73